MVCWLLMLYFCCAVPLLVVKGGEGSYGGCFRNGIEGGTNFGCTDAVEFLVLVLCAI